ncbi:MAG TPA: hypothetical protein VET48_04430, partial [Steroidobacteraceae bacterium]|nr:hypothetical protein [Steroidobacteraceae bacterium]
MYQFPAWRYWLVGVVLVLGVLFALPTVFGFNPALQIAKLDRQASTMDAAAEQRIVGFLQAKNLVFKDSRVDENHVLVRFLTPDQQSAARDALSAEFSKEYGVALADASAAPSWMLATGFLKPITFGLDLRGGVHFMYEVDVQSAVRQAMDRLDRSVRTVLRDKRIPYTTIVTEKDRVKVVLREANQLDAAIEALKKAEEGVAVTSESTDAGPMVAVQLTPDAVRQRQEGALEQNIITIRKRVNELGVSEPMVQRQGRDRIVIELPGVKDPNQAIRVLGSTTTLEWHMVDEANDPAAAAASKRVPLGSRLSKMRDTGAPILMKRELIVTGSQMVNASSGQSNDGRPAVNVTLNGPGGSAMLKNTTQNVGHRMAV